MHGTRVKHARDALKKLEPGSVRGSELDETKKKFAVPFVDRYNLMTGVYSERKRLFRERKRLEICESPFRSMIFSALSAESHLPRNSD